jgi:hypothetical protein
VRYVTLGTIFNDAALFRPLLAALDGELSGRARPRPRGASVRPGR